MSDMVFWLGQFVRNGKEFTGLITESGVFDLKTLGATAPATQQVTPFSTLQDLLGDWTANFDRLCALAAKAQQAGIAPIATSSLDGLNPRPPIARPARMLYAAANYRDHVAGMRKTFTSALPPAGDQKSGGELQPYMFAKACAQTGAFDDIVLPSGIARTDWEAELALVIGKPGRNIPPEKVGDHIAGYMTTNDVSCRDLTWREDRPAIRSDWLSGKSFDSFAPMGPFFTPKAFVKDHANLSIRLWVNGDLKQDGNSKDMIIGIDDQVAYASRRMTLQPGDIISTGTPAGTGQERLEFFKPGDIVETEVELCGRQRNRIVAGTSEYMPG